MGEVDYGADYGIVGGTGSASTSLFSREVSDVDKQRWSWEDAARDAKRIPLGFVGPPKAAKKKPRAKAKKK